jgi:DNA processing protein
LFKEGNFNLQNKPIISIVGTRKITSYGRDFCEKLIADLAGFNPIIVSGFAYGVDICAHRAALKNNLQTIGVLAHGFEETYPKAHKKYVSEINENGGFLTDFWHNDALIRENFLKRNRIVAGISEATIIIESAEKGGSLVTADIANSYSRDVFAVPGRSTDNFSKGCNDLIKRNKAAILTCATDLVEMLNWDIATKKTPTIQKQLFVEMTETEQLVYDYLVENGKELLDIISLNCKLPIHQTTTLLFNLEMKGVVKPLPGKLFEVV